MTPQNRGTIFSAFSVRMLEIVEPLMTKPAGASAMADSTIQIEGFDPGSERTLAAWIRHASRATAGASAPVRSGERVSNA